LLAGALSETGDAGKAARQRVAHYVETKVLSDSKTMQAAGAKTCSDIARGLKADLSSEAVAAWAQKLRSAFLDDAAALGALKLDDAQRIASALEALGDRQAIGVVPAWVTGTGAWQALKPTELGSLADALARTGDAGKAARARFADYIAAKYMADATATKSVPCKDWRQIVWRLAPDLADEGRKAWAGKILSAYTGAGGVAGLKTTEVTDLVEVARLLGASDQGVVLAQQGLAGLAWTPGDLAALGRVLGWTGGPGKAARVQLAKYVSDKYLPGPDAVRSVACRQWKDLVDNVRGDLSSETKAAWTAKLRGAFDRNVLVTLKFYDAWDLGDALEGLGAFQAYDVLLPQMANSTEWRSAGPGGLANLAWRLDGLGDRAKAPLLALAEHVAATYLGSQERTKSLDLGLWSRLTPLGRHLSDEARQAWARALKEAFAPDEPALLKMAARDVTNLARALDPLDKNLSNDLAYAWFTGNPSLGTVKRDELLSVAQVVVDSKTRPKAEREGLLLALEKVLASTAIKQEEVLDLANQMLRLWNAVGNFGKLEEWGTKAYESVLGTEEARSAASMERLEQIARLLYHYSLSGKGKAFPGFVQAIARHARQGTLKPVHVVAFASFLGTPEMRQTLQTELLDTQGSPRLPVAKVLSWAYRDAKEMKPWRTYVQERIATAVDADAKALWTIVKADVEVLLPEQPEPLRRQRWLNEALASTSSENVRLTVLGELADSYRECNAHSAAVDLLESVKGQFSQEGAASIGRLQESLKNEDAKWRGQESARQAVRDGAIRKGRLAYLQRCLTRAEATGNAQEADTLRMEIQRLQQEP
jgi:hypothetical protein